MGRIGARGRGRMWWEWVGGGLEGQTDMEVRGCNGGCRPFKSHREGENGMEGSWKDMEGMEDRVCNRGCGPFKSHRERNGVGMGWKGPGRTWRYGMDGLEGSWKDMDGPMTDP